MKQRRPYLPLLFLILLAILLTSCKEEQQNGFQGYIEGEYLHVSSPIGGRLETLSAVRGMTAAEGAPLFTLDQTLETAAAAEAGQNVQRAESRLANLTKGLRPSEIQAIEAKLEQARASHDLAAIEYGRREQLHQQKAVSLEALDRTRTELDRSAAAVAQLQAELATARLGARPDEIEAARAEAEAARQKLAQARWALEQKQQTAPQNGLVFDTYYQEGEFVPAGRPVVSLLPPAHIKVRFFVPESRLTSLTMGQQVFVKVNGAAKAYLATVTYLSPRAEYTPPVIYSRETRSKLVFMVEASFSAAEAASLHPGQPAEVSPETNNG